MSRGLYRRGPKGRTGLIKNADGGTLFLDEIGELSLPRPKFWMCWRISVISCGGNAFQHVDVRITAATNQNLIELIKQKKFRSDLYWRLNIIKVTIPPLRERRGYYPAGQLFSEKEQPEIRHQQAL